VTVASSRVFVDGALEGRVAIVTGGGTNLGKAAASELVRSGASVVIAGRRAATLEAAAEIGERCSWVAAHIRERTGAERIVGTALERFGRLDLVLNNASGQLGADV
jgi:citronellol/citronellal dehydrogenase